MFATEHQLVPPPLLSYPLCCPTHSFRVFDLRRFPGLPFDDHTECASMITGLWPFLWMKALADLFCECATTGTISGGTLPLFSCVQVFFVTIFEVHFQFFFDWFSRSQTRCSVCPQSLPRITTTSCAIQKVLAITSLSKHRRNTRFNDVFGLNVHSGEK